MENLEQLNSCNNSEEQDINPPGFRFNPYDSELLEEYLLKLVYHENSPEGLGIPAVDLYCAAPQELTAKYEEHCENQWYFFTKRNRKYSGGNRPNRGAGNGFWKQTNVNRPVFKVLKDKTKVELGRKVTLDYHDKSLKTAGQRTDWKMHEYRVNHKLPGLPSNYNTAGSSSELDEWCLCRIYISSRSGNKADDAGANSEEENEQEEVPTEADATLIPQNTAPASNDQHFVAPQEYYGQNAGGLDANSFPLSTNPLINDAFSNSSNSFYYANTIDGQMNWMDYNNNFGLIDHVEIYPTADQLHDNGFAQPIRSLPATGLPMLPYSNFNQSSSSISGDFTSGQGDGSLASVVYGNRQNSFNRGSTKVVFDHFGN
ncbi:hypothetical protein DCAR_0727183 [Daucus carota subsp. sativus]|uniref:NAC domain-containing protein n=1 Tax=Daucus carota subsp. sativus TaxID=79200 RepID=A0A161ZI66_DAUCS|nr:PREDICTED: NAC transcription factor 29-like [Daucus carota subsp. sativus]WOH07750.1 hypothetical protein DCAR_0727183 [Daucus carota subsp. sativus]